MWLRMWLLSARALWLFILVACALRVAIHCHVWRGLFLSSTACQYGFLSTHIWFSGPAWVPGGHGHLPGHPKTPKALQNGTQRDTQ